MGVQQVATRWVSVGGTSGPSPWTRAHDLKATKGFFLQVRCAYPLQTVEAPSKTGMRGDIMVPPWERTRCNTPISAVSLCAPRNRRNHLTRPSNEQSHLDTRQAHCRCSLHTALLDRTRCRDTATTSSNAAAVVLVKAPTPHHRAINIATRSRSSAVLTSGPGLSVASATRIRRPFSNARSCSSFSAFSSAVGASDARRRNAATR